LLTVESVEKVYMKGGLFAGEKQYVLKGISLTCRQGECLGIIGESGSGKSTLARLILGIEKPDRGTVRLDGRDVSARSSRTGRISTVFQDYTSSINPFYTVEQALMEPLRLRRDSKQALHEKMDALLMQVGLDPSYRRQYPHELSGGEAQRVCIARAVATEPKLIVLDEAISSLDGSVQLQVLELLRSLRSRYGMGYIFITHDIQAAAYLCDRIAVIRSGRIEVTVKVEELKDVPCAYARKLLQMVIT